MNKIIYIIILIFLLKSFPSFGSVNGKGIVCTCTVCNLNHIDPTSYITDGKPSEIGFHFKNNKVAIYYISKISDTIKVMENIKITLRKKKKFYINDNEINWTYKDNLNIYAYKLDRKTLRLKKMNIIKTKTFNLRKCNAYLEGIFFEKMDALSEKYQNGYNKKPARNKI